MNCTSRNSVNVPMSLASIICHDEIFIYLFFLSNYLNNVFPSLISRLIFLSLFTVVIHSGHISLFIFYQVKCKVFLFLNSDRSSLISRVFHVFIFFLSFLVFSFTQVTFRLFIFSSSPMPKFEMCNCLLLLTIRSCCCCNFCNRRSYITV